MDNLKRQRAYSLSCNVPHTPSRPTRTALANVNSASLVTPINARRRPNHPVTPQTDPPAPTKRNSLFNAGAQARIYAPSQSLCYGANENMNMMMNDLSLTGIDEDDALWEDQQQQAAQYNLSLYNGDVSYRDTYDEDGFHAFYTSSEQPFGVQSAVQPAQVVATSTPVKLPPIHHHQQQQKRQQAHVSQPQSQVPPSQQSQCALCSRPNPSALLIPCSHKICTSCFTSSVNIVGEKSMKCSVPGCTVEVHDFKLVPASASSTVTESAASGASTPSKPSAPRAASGGHSRHTYTESAELDFFQDMLDGEAVRSSTPRPSPQKDQTTIVLRIDNVPWDITPPGLHAFFSLPAGILARAHVLLDRKGKTLSHAFVEIKGEQWARAVLRGDYSSGASTTSSRPGSARPVAGKSSTVGGGSGVLGEGRRKRGVTITRGSMGELMTALFPSFKGTFDSTSGLPVVSCDINASRYPRYLFSMDEIRGMSTLIKEPTQFVKSATLPIYALISVLGHVPAASSSSAGAGQDKGQFALGYVFGPDAVRALEGAVKDAIVILKAKYVENGKHQSNQEVVEDDDPHKKKVHDTHERKDATTHSVALTAAAKSTDQEGPVSATSTPSPTIAPPTPSLGAPVKSIGEHPAPPPFKVDEVEVLFKELAQSVSACRAFTSNQISSLTDLIPAAARPSLEGNTNSPSMSIDSSFESPSFSRSRGFPSKRLPLEAPSFIAEGETEFVSAMSSQDLEFSLENSVSFDSPYQPRAYSRGQQISHHRDRSSSSSSSASASFQMDEGFSLPNLLQSHAMLSGKQGVGRMNQSYAGYPGQVMGANYPSTPATGKPTSTPSPPSLSSPSEQYQSAGHTAPHPPASYSHGRAALGLGRRVPNSHPGLKRNEMRSASSMMATPNMFAGEPLSPYANRGMGGNLSMGGMGMSGLGALNPNASVGPGVPPGLASRAGSSMKRVHNDNGARPSGHGDDLGNLAREFGVGVDIVEALAKRLGGRNVTF